MTEQDNNNNAAATDVVMTEDSSQGKDQTMTSADVDIEMRTETAQSTAADSVQESGAQSALKTDQVIDATNQVVENPDE